VEKVFMSVGYSHNSFRPLTVLIKLPSWCRHQALAPLVNLGSFRRLLDTLDLGALLKGHRRDLFVVELVIADQAQLSTR